MNAMHAARRTNLKIIRLRERIQSQVTYSITPFINV